MTHLHLHLQNNRVPILKQADLFLWRRAAAARGMESWGESFPAGGAAAAAGTMEGWTGGFPAGAHLFSDPPLYWCPSSPILPAETAFEVYSAYENSEIQQYLEEPQDESHLPDLLGIVSSPTSDHDTIIQTCAHVPPEMEKVREWGWAPMPYTALPEQEEVPATTVLGSERGGNEEEDEEKEEMREAAGSTCPMPCRRRRTPVPTAAPREEGSCSSSIDLLAYMPKSGSGLRQPRQKRHWWPMPDHFWDFCSASKSNKHEHRKNNDEWEPEEVKLLVDGISNLGVGRWTKLKSKWFSPQKKKKNKCFSASDQVRPVRTAVHLKDKWRNLVKAYVSKPTSKKKGKNAHLDKDLINKIKLLAVEYPYPK
uniref:Uncharacterized protein n=1 Tax=Avena sativa TaxID=4498 RepID=A0ACD5ZLI2_AVESA